MVVLRHFDTVNLGAKNSSVVIANFKHLGANRTEFGFGNLFPVAVSFALFQISGAIPADRAVACVARPAPSRQ